MSDMDDASLIRDVYRKLADAAFRNVLKATSSNGEHPVTVARKEELVRVVLERVRAVGGVSNIVVPTGSGYDIIALEIETTPAKSNGGSDPIRDNCTLGVLLARMTMDGAATRTLSYAITSPNGLEELEHGSAELVAVDA